jgi:hypothetical protein
MKRKTLGVLATLLGALGLCSLTQAAVVLDQVGQPVEYDGNSTISNQMPGPLWQTFTVGVNGLLEAVDLAIWHFDTESASPPPLTVTVQTVTAGGVPSGTILATVKAGASLFPDTWVSLDPFLVAFTYIDVSAFGISVAVGDRLAITAGLTAEDLTNAGCSTVGSPIPFCLPSLYQWAGNNDSFYGNGTAGNESTLFPSSDFGFRTYVRVPEPGTLACSALASQASVQCGGRK